MIKKIILFPPIQRIEIFQNRTVTLKIIIGGRDYHVRFALKKDIRTGSILKLSVFFRDKPVPPQKTVNNAELTNSVSSEDLKNSD